FFARPKKRNQKKGRPVAAYSLRSSLSPRVARRAILGPLATRCIHAAPLRAVLAESSGARRGKRGKVPIETSARAFSLVGYALRTFSKICRSF
ncbi:hypothetical protein, partial [Methylobacter sp. BlB1]|uniref:hypothetical protein n=1 Tax=Methylobacter sp. BlB1 TaxID=2785914 RepID=UPI001E5E8602